VAALAALLLTVDGLAFTTSRVAMLDVFLTLFIVVGFGLLLLDRDRQWSGLEAHRPIIGAELEPRPLPRRPHLFRWLAGVAFGLALATKWSALLALAAAGLFVAVSDLLWRRRITGRAFVRLDRLVASGLLTMVVVPLAVYVLSHAGWFANADATRNGAAICPDGNCGAVAVVQGWLSEQREIAGFHASLEAEHPYRAPATTWLFMTRPVAYYWEACDDPANPPEGGCQVEEGNVEEILGLGNPAIWWMGLVASPILAVVGVRRRDWRVPAILGFLALQTLPWLASPRPVFLFYAAPAVPFVCLALAAVCDRALNVRALRWLPAAVAVVAVGTFLYFLPVYSGMELSRDAWDARIWFSSWV
jgi:dolichyl-phosphate-mannose-protein mannosyltransferase